MKKIAFISAINGLPWAACEELWSQSAIRLARSGCAVAANVCYRPEPTAKLRALSAAGCRVDQRPLRSSVRTLAYRAWGVVQGTLHQPETFPGYRAVYRWLREVRPALVVITQDFHTRGLEWLELCEKLSFPYVTIIHAASECSWPEDEKGERLGRAIERAAGSFFVSQKNLELVRIQTGAALSGAKVVRNPFNVPYDVSLPWPDDSGVTKLACVARLHPKSKGQDILFDVLRQTKWRSRPLRVSLFGAGPNRESLLALQRSYALSNVTFAGFTDSVEAIWRAHHALILPSRYEGLPLAVVEASLCGRPSIVTDVAGNAELLTDNVSAFVAAAPAAQFVDEALERAWGRRAEWRGIGACAAKEIRTHVPPDPIEVFTAQLLSLI